MCIVRRICSIAQKMCSNSYLAALGQSGTRAVLASSVSNSVVSLAYIYAYIKHAVWFPDVGVCKQCIRLHSTVSSMWASRLYSGGKKSLSVSHSSEDP